MSVPLPGSRQAAATTLTVMTWNVQNASAARAHQQAAWLARGPAEALAAYGFTTYTPAPAGDARDYVVTLAVRGLVHLRPDPTTAPRFVGLVGMYVPSRGPRERRNVDMRAFQGAVAELLAALPERLDVDGGPVIVAGDLNVVEPDHIPAHANFGTWEDDFYRAFDKAGLTDAYRHLHPGGLEHSWFGRRSGAGYRLDHLFTGAAHVDALTGCRYDHEPRLLGLSDHAALLATITT